MKRIKLIIFVLATMGVMSSCNVDRYLAPGQRVLVHNSMEITMTDSTSVTPEVESAMANVRQYYYQTPNKRMLGVPLKLWMYCLPKPGDTSWLARFWHRQGEPPIVYDRAASLRTANQLAMLLKTKGCFGSMVTADTTHVGKGGVIVRYHVAATQRRKIDELRFFSRQEDIRNLLQKDAENSLLKVGDYYDQEIMTEEQSRIVDLLKNNGYYMASNEMVNYLVDTTYDNSTLSVLVSVRRPQNASANTTREHFLDKYHIDSIYIYPNITTVMSSEGHKYDTLAYDYSNKNGQTTYYFIHDTKINPSPKAISRSMFIFQRMTYRPRIVANTSKALLGLHNFKYVDIKFEESPSSTDSNRLLNARVRLLNSSRHKLSLSFELTNASDLGMNKEEGNFLTSGNIGLGTTLGYQNKNLFGGAELLNVEGGLVFDFPKNVFGTGDHTFYNTFSNFENNLTMSLDLPSFLLPFGNRIVWQNNKPHTLIELNVNYLYRNLLIPSIASWGNEEVTLERTRLGGSFGYTWNQGTNVQHKLLPVNFSYSHLWSGDAYYHYLTQLTHDPQFEYQAVDYVLLNTHYEYTYSGQVLGQRKNFNYLHLSVETAGNLLNWADRLLGGDEIDEGDDVLYYQYFRVESEFKRYIHLGDKSTFVMRGLAGVGLPYGHSTFIPYEKMFVGGGPTTMRGWALRHLGYGQYPTSTTNFAMGTGEIQLVVNLEYRFPLVGIFEGAVFSDLGNVWQYTEWGIGNTSTPFSLKEIGKGVAFDAGIGLRANISIITLRMDMALPFYDPGYPTGQRWLNNHWSWNKIALNFGINYPF